MGQRTRTSTISIGSVLGTVRSRNNLESDTNIGNAVGNGPIRGLNFCF